MGIEAIYRRPNTSKPAPGHKIYPVSPAQADGDHRPTRSGQWTSPTSRWRAASSISPPLSTGSAAGFWPGGSPSRWRRRSASRRLRRRWREHGRPEIFNTDQGSQFTSAAFTGVLLDNGIAISMDGKGCLARQRLRRADLAIGQIRGGLSQGLRPVSARRASRSAGIWIFTIARDPIRALTGRPRTRPTSIICRKGRQRELRRAFGTQLRSGYALPASHPKSASTQPRKPGRNPLISSAKLFRQPEPALAHESNGCLRLDLLGVTGVAPRSSSRWRNSALS